LRAEHVAEHRFYDAVTAFVDSCQACHEWLLASYLTCGIAFVARSTGAATVLIITLALGWVVEPFFGAVMWGLVAAILFAPVHHRLLAALPGKRNSAAALAAAAPRPRSAAGGAAHSEATAGPRASRRRQEHHRQEHHRMNLGQNEPNSPKGSPPAP
jgi:hypothetical protein